MGGGQISTMRGNYAALLLAAESGRALALAPDTELAGLQRGATPKPPRLVLAGGAGGLESHNSGRCAGDRDVEANVRDVSALVPQGVDREGLGVEHILVPGGELPDVGIVAHAHPSLELEQAVGLPQSNAVVETVLRECNLQAKVGKRTTCERFACKCGQ